MADYNEPVWKSKDGQLHVISQMTDDHLKNAIEYLENKVDVAWDPAEFYNLQERTLLTKAYLEIMREELKKRENSV